MRYAITFVAHALRDFAIELFCVLVVLIFSAVRKWVKNKTKEITMSEVENKSFEMKLEGEFLLISVDPNKDGEKLIELKVSLKEVPDEVLSAFKKD